MSKLIARICGFKTQKAIHPEGHITQDVQRTKGKEDWDPIAAATPGGYSIYNVPQGGLRHYHYNKIVTHDKLSNQVDDWDTKRMGIKQHNDDGILHIPQTPEEAIHNGADPKVVRSWGRYFNLSTNYTDPQNPRTLDVVRATLYDNRDFVSMYEGAKSAEYQHAPQPSGLVTYWNSRTIFGEYETIMGNQHGIQAVRVFLFLLTCLIIFETQVPTWSFPNWRIWMNIHDINERERRQVRDGLTWDQCNKITRDEGDDDDE